MEWLPLALLVGGLLLILVEALNPGFFAAVPGAGLVFAAVVLWVAPDAIDGPLGFIGIPLVLVLTSVVSIFAYRRLGPEAERTTVPQYAELPGQEGTVTETIPAPPGRGEVLVGGRHHEARAANPIAKGAAVRIRAVEGHTLVVEDL